MNVSMVNAETYEVNWFEENPGATYTGQSSNNLYTSYIIDENGELQVSGTKFDLDKKGDTRIGYYRSIGLNSTFYKIEGTGEVRDELPVFKRYKAHVSHLTDNNVTTIEKLPTGSIVYDPNSIWQYKDDVNYSGNNMKKEPVEWIVTAHNHFSPNTTLLTSKEAVAILTRDYNTKGWLNSNLRNWLRNTFRGQLSVEFRNKIIDVTVYTESYASQENVFVLSKTELGGDSSDISGNHGSTIAYFSSNDLRKAKGYRSDRNWTNYYNVYDYIHYWTRSPHIRDTTSAVIVDRSGEFSLQYIGNGYQGVRPSVNIKSNTLVQHMGNNKYKIIWNDPPTMPGLFINPTNTSNLQGEQNVTVKWGVSTDPEGEPIKYQLDFYNGSSWSTLSSSVTIAQFSWTVPTNVSTGNAKFRVRAIDSTGSNTWSDYRESSTFSIYQNAKPTLNISLKENRYFDVVSIWV